jgi:hypothetical protein
MPAGLTLAPAGRRIVPAFGFRAGENLPIRHKFYKNLKYGRFVFVQRHAATKDASKQIKHLITITYFDIFPAVVASSQCLSASLYNRKILCAYDQMMEVRNISATA